MRLLSPINMEDYHYPLPQERIAEYPVEVRDRSKLLITGADGIREDRFYSLTDHLPGNGLIVFNNTRVIRARLLFRKETGARIEVFCLEPVEPTAEVNKAFEATSGVTWKCLIGNAKKWRSGVLELQLGDAVLYAERIGEEENAFLVRFRWDPPALSFAHIIEEAGKIPLPPYIDREAEEEDARRYQTIYARHNGSVAAPTAGLHFTDEVMASLREKNIRFGNVILHVGAGTFKPVADEDIRDHLMHTEQLVIERKLILQLLDQSEYVLAVGTTSMRTLESLYWFGNILEDDPDAEFSIRQWTPYGDRKAVATRDALQNVLSYMDRNALEEISGETSLIIVPGYEFRIVDILLTNFHMPKSTLLLLVAAFAGEAWKASYQYALEHDFRFLSYGDSCLFFRKDQKG